MTLSPFGLQVLNGLEQGLLLFLVASGLTLIFGVLVKGRVVFSGTTAQFRERAEENLALLRA